MEQYSLWIHRYAKGRIRDEGTDEKIGKGGPEAYVSGPVVKEG